MRDMNKPFPVIAIVRRPALVAPALEVADGLKLPLVHRTRITTRLVDAYLAAPGAGPQAAMGGPARHAGASANYGRPKRRRLSRSWTSFWQWPPRLHEAEHRRRS